jgi:hypothetical protein
MRSFVVLIAAVPAMAADRTAEIERLKPVAEKGEAAAQYQLRLLYAEGKDLPEAAHCYKLAADLEPSRPDAVGLGRNPRHSCKSPSRRSCADKVSVAAGAGLLNASVQHHTRSRTC